MKKNKKILILLLFSLFFILFSSTSFADELPSEVTAIIEAFENDSSLYKNYFDNYIIYRNTNSNDIVVLLYNSTNTKFAVNGNYFTAFYCYSDNNLCYNNGSSNHFLGSYLYYPQNDSFGYFIAGATCGTRQTSGYAVSHESFDNMQILYSSCDIYAYSDSVYSGYNATLPFEFENLDVYLEATVIEEENNQENNNEENNNEENQDENSIINYNDKLDSIQEELEQVNTNIVYVLDFYLIEVALLLSIIIYLFLHFMLERRKI